MFFSPRPNPRQRRPRRQNPRNLGRFRVYWIREFGVRVTEVIAMIFHVDEYRCERCGTCAAVCPMGIIIWENRETLPRPATGAEKLCINCGHCLAVCPQSALELAVMPIDQCPKIVPAATADSGAYAALVKSRRSIRVYKKEKVEKEIIAALIDIARYAPTGKNTQQLNWLVIQGRDRLDPLVEHGIDWMRDMVTKKHPMAAGFGMEGIIAAHEAGDDIILRNAPCLVVVSGPKSYPGTTVDAVIALATFELAAAAEGLGTCWAGFFHIACSMWPPLMEALQLPRGHIPGFSMMLGRAKFRHKRVPLRKPARIDWRL